MSRTSRTSILAWLIDVALVGAFVLIGRRSHGEDPSGFALTLLPFFAALQTGWLVRAGRDPLAPLRSGVLIWAITVVLGLLLRVAVGDDAPLPFVLVTGAVLAALLVGWRALFAVVRRLRARRRVA